MFLKNLMLSAFVFLSVAMVYANDPHLNKAALERFLKKNPSADINNDGKLSEDEYRTYIIRTVKDKKHLHIMMPMRDGVKLATEIFIPEGKGPWPVILTRVVYGRYGSATALGSRKKYSGFVLVFQDLRGCGGSEGKDNSGKANFDAKSFDNEINDGYDTVEWIAKQKWCNGKVGIIGGSGNALAAYMAYLAAPPHLAVIDTFHSGGTSYLYWTFHNGVRREMYNWLVYRNIRIASWPKPTITLFDRKKYDSLVKKQAEGNKSVFIAKSGWYDIFAEAALDYFAAFGKNGKCFVLLNASGHGRLKGLKYPAGKVPKEGKLPTAISVLKGEKLPDKSILLYYLMGDTKDKNAPGNCYKISHVWPVPNSPTSFYLKKDGSTDGKIPAASKACLTFKYNPKNPVPSVGGDVFTKYHKEGVGSLDQRVLKNRKDILRFSSKPLEGPLEITGKVWAELYVSTDVPDTTFTVKLIDIYPDGYEAIVRDSIMMTRFHEGFDRSAPVLPGKVYKLKIDMWSTALVFNKGHRIGIHISSSNCPKYEVHPNSFNPVYSFKNSPEANNTVYLSAKYPSRIILPVVKEDKNK